MDNITGILIVGFIVLGIYKLFELYAKRDERKSIIEKLPIFWENMNAKEPIILPDILYKKQISGNWALRISLLLIGIGLGCAIGFIFQFCFFGVDYLSEEYTVIAKIEDVQTIIYFAFISFFGGLGLLGAYFIEQQQAKKKQ